LQAARNDKKKLHKPRLAIE